MKGLHNRKFRRVNKQRVKMGLEPKKMDELINQYDVCDWRLEFFEGPKQGLARWWRQSKEAYEDFMNKLFRK